MCLNRLNDSVLNVRAKENRRLVCANEMQVRVNAMLAV